MTKHVLNIRDAARLVVEARLAGNATTMCLLLADTLETAIGEIKMHRRCADAIDEALNSDNGTYKP